MRARGRLRPRPRNGGRHRGGVGTPLEGTYFQAKLGNAMCVQSLDDSLNSAIHITYRISLRSSSLREPRYPSTGVVVRFVVGRARAHVSRPRARDGVGRSRPTTRVGPLPNGALAATKICHARPHAHAPPTHATQAREAARRGRHQDDRRPLLQAQEQEPVRTGFGMDTGNDPSAGSPTETLLRLLLPLNDKVYSTFRKINRNCKFRSPKYSPDHSIGRSDGRCVQRAGT